MAKYVAIFVIMIILPTSAFAQWVRVDSGLPGKVYTLLAEGNNLYAGSDSGLFRSSDFGVNWAPAGFHDTTIWVLAGGDSNLFAGSSADLFKGSIQGTNWSAIPALHKSYTGGPILISGNTIIAGIYDSIVRSTDNGITWSAISTGHSTWSCLVSDGQNLYAAAQYYGVFRSSDSGSTWTASSVGLPSSYPEVSSLACLGNTIFVGIGNYYDTSIFMSTNYGESWSPTENGPSYVTSLTVNGNIVLAGGSEGIVFVSTDTGDTWSQVSEDGLENQLNPFGAMVVAGPYLFAESGVGGVWRFPLADIVPSNVVAQDALGTGSLSVYPNPISTHAMINLSSPQAGHADVTMVNKLGMKVAKIFSGTLESGSHSFLWNSTGVAAGMYECLVKMNGTMKCIPIIIE